MISLGDANSLQNKSTTDAIIVEDGSFSWGTDTPVLNKLVALIAFTFTVILLPPSLPLVTQQINCPFLPEQSPSSSLLRPFPYLGSANRVLNLHVLRYCDSSIFTCFSRMSFLITSLHLCFGLPIFRCPPTSILYLPLSFPEHVLTISFSLLLCFHLYLPLALISF